MPSPDTVFHDAADHLDDRREAYTLPDRHRINPDVVAQPVEGSGYVYGQVGWLDDGGTPYGLRLPDTMDRDGTTLRPLYICLGRRVASAQPPTGPDAGETEPCE